MKNAKVTFTSAFNKLNKLQVVNKTQLNAIKGGINRADPPRRRKKR
ncbi:MAG: hypothetical protein AAF990_28055 [Bacteroidota bacterium]